MKLPQISSCDRIMFIQERIKGKKALHIGCANWPATKELIKNKSLLHLKMLDVNSDLYGVDISEEGINIMISEGIRNVYSCDAQKSLYECLHDKFDVVVAAEIIEHCINPGLLLDSIKTVLKNDSLLLITTPNFSPIKRIPRLLWRSEVVNLDHTFYSSFSTLSCLLKSCGYTPIEWYSSWWDVGFISKLINKLFRKIGCLQYYADNILVTSILSKNK